jgi:C4-dicarboxylate-specific signal transduction histidine kinase
MVQSDQGDLMVGSSFLPELPFAPALGWSIRLTVGTSSASRQLTETVRMSYAWILMASVGLMVLTVAYLRRLVISRYLQQQVTIRTAELHQTTRDLEKQNRELERHKRDLVATNHQLIEAQRELLDTAKRLGQSEVAALTLHNIGNIITSLNIQSTLLREQLERDAPGQLTMAYLKKIEAEGRFPEGLASMRGRLEAAEQDAIVHMQNVMRGLIDNVRMAMAAISSQLAFVHQRECAEPYKLSELLQHTLILYFGTFKRHRVLQIMKIQKDAIFLTERFLFESILTVLIRNAVDATSDQEERSILFATELDDAGLSLLIQDNGHGFSGEVGSQIFRFGFSTKARGHGFGLHYAANSCRHLGLELSLDSPGPGQGATARLRIPRERIVSVMEFVDVPQNGEGERGDQSDPKGPSSVRNSGRHEA